MRVRVRVHLTRGGNEEEQKARNRVCHCLIVRCGGRQLDGRASSRSGNGTLKKHRRWTMRG